MERMIEKISVSQRNGVTVTYTEAENADSIKSTLQTDDLPSPTLELTMQEFLAVAADEFLLGDEWRGGNIDYTPPVTGLSFKHVGSEAGVTISMRMDSTDGTFCLNCPYLKPEGVNQGLVQKILREIDAYIDGNRAQLELFND